MTNSLKYLGKVEYVQCGDYFLCKVDGKLMRCISCGKPIEYAGPKSDRANHKCPQSHEARKQSADTRLREPQVRGKPWGQRLADGCEYLGLEDGE
jgi:hypothetical protein